MATSKLFEVHSDTLECVLSSLNYSSVNSCNEDVKKIQEWMKEQPHLPEIMDDKRIQNFLILNKGSVEKTKQKIDHYYTIRLKLPEIYEHANPKLPYVELVLRALYIFPLPKLTKENCRVFFFRTRDKSLAEKISFTDALRVALNLQEIRLKEDVMYGDIMVFDGHNFPYSFLAKITPVLLHKTLVLVYKKVFSNRLKAVYLINTSYADAIISLFKLVMKPKLLERIHVCKNSNFVVEHFGKEIIPRDYGGEEKSFEELGDILLQTFSQYQEHFDKLDELRVDEKLRPEKPEDDDFLGFHGNFKKLELD